MSLKGSAKQLEQSRVSLWLGVRCLGLSSETPDVFTSRARVWARARGGFARAGGFRARRGNSRAPGDVRARRGMLRIVRTLHIVAVALRHRLQEFESYKTRQGSTSESPAFERYGTFSGLAQPGNGTRERGIGTGE